MTFKKLMIILSIVSVVSAFFFYIGMYPLGKDCRVGYFDIDR